MYMPFGKYQDRPLDQVPDNYLLWLYDKCPNISPTLRQYIRNRLKLPDPPTPSVPAINWPEVLQEWHRGLIRDFASGQRGSADALRMIDEAYLRLCQRLGLACPLPRRS
jgi:hypothetical protein